MVLGCSRSSATITTTDDRTATVTITQQAALHMRCLRSAAAAAAVAAAASCSSTARLGATTGRASSVARPLFGLDTCIMVTNAVLPTPTRTARRSVSTHRGRCALCRHSSVTDSDGSGCRQVMMAVNLNLDFVWVPHLQAVPSSAWFHTHMQPPRRRSCITLSRGAVLPWAHLFPVWAGWLRQLLCSCGGGTTMEVRSAGSGRVVGLSRVPVSGSSTHSVAADCCCRDLMHARRRTLDFHSRARRSGESTAQHCRHGLLADTLTPCGLYRWRRTGEMWHSESATSGKTSGSSTPWSAPSTSSGSTLC